MPSLVPGLDDHVENELERLRAELKVAIAESGYSLEQVATLAGVARTTLRAMLIGEVASQADTLIRAAFIVGARVELTRAEASDSPPFEIVPLATGSRRSSATSAASVKRAGGGVVKAQTSDVASKRTAAEQRKKSAARKRSNHRLTQLAA